MARGVFNQLFDDESAVCAIQNKLPKLFQLAELESSRNGKIGMEIGSVRERILIAFFMYKYGVDVVATDLNITESETDLVMHGEPLSIKTFTTKTSRISSGVKLIWTVDAQKALEFKSSYLANSDMLLTQVVWGGTGFLYLFSRDSQNSVLEQIGRDRYIKLPKAGTNPRGVEITAEALQLLSKHPDTRTIEIPFSREYLDPRQIYSKWLDLWNE